MKQVFSGLLRCDVLSLSERRPTFRSSVQPSFLRSSAHDASERRRYVLSNVTNLQRHGVTSHKTGILRVSDNFSLHTKNLTKPRRIRSAEYVSRRGDRKDVYWVLMGSSDRKRPLGRRRRRWEDNTNVNLQQVEWGGMDWIGLAEKWECWRAKRGNEPSGSVKFGAFLV
jgi:hypothetical protein